MLTTQTILPVFGLPQAAAAAVDPTRLTNIGGLSALGSCINRLNELEEEPPANQPLAEIEAMELSEQLSRFGMYHLEDHPEIRLDKIEGRKNLASMLITPLSERAKLYADRVRHRTDIVPLFATTPDLPIIHQGLQAPDLSSAVTHGWLTPEAAAVLARELSGHLYANILLLSELDKRIGEFEHSGLELLGTVGLFFGGLFFVGNTLANAQIAPTVAAIALLMCSGASAGISLVGGYFLLKKVLDRRKHSIGLFGELRQNSGGSRKTTRAALKDQLKLYNEYLAHFPDIRIDHLDELRRAGILPEGEAETVTIRY